MSDKHQQSRTGLMVNSALFLGAGVLLVGNFITNLAESSGSFQYLTTFASLGIGAGLGGLNVKQAWSAFSNLQYGETMKKGIIAWVVPAGMVLLDIIF